jgi:hypothetical protein
VTGAERVWRLLLLAVTVAGCVGVGAQSALAGHETGASDVDPLALSTPLEATAGSPTVHHYEYVFLPGEMYVYDMDEDQQLVQHVTGLPDEDGVRGVMVNPAVHILYISHGSDGPAGNKGSLLAYDLISGTVLWNRTYEFPIDSGAITPDGKTIYMPTGENDASGIWNILNAANGEPIGQIQGGDGEVEIGAHNTIVSLDGKYVFLGARNSDYLDLASTATNQVVQKIGPLENGVRPFTVNGTNTLAYTTATEFLGFQISSIVTGKVLYTVPIPGFTVPGTFTLSAPSHGITLTPNELQLYVMDAANSYVHVFDVGDVPAEAPTLLKNIPLAPIEGEEQPCAYDCGKSGWLQASLDGRFVYVGDSGAVIDTSTHEVIATLPALAESREMLEIDWADGVPVATSSRYGLGYVTSGVGSPPSEEPARNKEQSSSEGASSNPSSAGMGQPSSGGLSLVSQMPAGLSVAAVPVLRGLSVSPSSFRAGGKGASVARVAISSGAEIRYTDSEPASTAFTVVAVRSGTQNAARGCIGPGSKHHRRCARYASSGSFIHLDHSGLNAFHFTGRIGGLKLKPGLYRMRAVPTSADRAGAASTVWFRVIG